MAGRGVDRRETGPGGSEAAMRGEAAMRSAIRLAIKGAVSGSGRALRRGLLQPRGRDEISLP